MNTKPAIIKKERPFTLHFGIDLLETDEVPLYYNKLYNKITHKQVGIKNSDNLKFLKNNFFLIDEIPNYLEAEISGKKEGIKLKKINTYEGSLIHLKGYDSLDVYLKGEISTQRRSTLKRCQKRLDLCIKPKYKMYYGEITREEYDTIFSAYKLMLTRRLAQKELYWEELDYWEERYKYTYDLIHKKKASVFVIYQGDKPISIYINSIYKSTLFIDVVTYDIDYSKFKLGFLALVNVIKWSIENHFDLIDMSKGDFYYKERFRNGVYVFQKHLVYDSKNISIAIKANYTYIKLATIYKLLPLLKKWKLHKFYQKYKNNRRKDFFKKFNEDLVIIEIKKDPGVISYDNLNLINIEEDTYRFLRKPFLDFLFLSFEFIGDILVFENKTENTYLFKGKNKTQSIFFKSRSNECN